MHIQSFGCLRRVKVCIYQRVDQFFTAVLHIFRQNLSIYIKDMIQFILWYDRLNEISDMIVKINTVVPAFCVLFKPSAMPVRIMIF